MEPSSATSDLSSLTPAYNAVPATPTSTMEDTTSDPSPINQTMEQLQSRIAELEEENHDLTYDLEHLSTEFRETLKDVASELTDFDVDPKADKRDHGFAARANEKNDSIDGSEGPLTDGRHDKCERRLHDLEYRVGNLVGLLHDILIKRLLGEVLECPQDGAWMI